MSTEARYQPTRCSPSPCGGPPGAGLTLGPAGQAVGLGDARALFPAVLLAVGVGRRRRLQLGAGGPGCSPSRVGPGAPRGGLDCPVG